MVEISIILVTFNRAHIIPKTLESIQNQKFRNFECLIIDDHSDDHTSDVVHEFIASDIRFSFHRRDSNFKKGLPGCRNYGLSKVQGNFVIFFDDDDLMHPNCLLYNYDLLSEGKYDYSRFERSVFTSYDEVFYDEDKEKIGKEINNNNLYEVITNKLPLNSCQVLWNKKCFNEINFNESLMYAEEWEAYIKIISKDFIGIRLNNVLMFARKHGKSNTGEYWAGNQIRLKSHIKAIELVLNYLIMYNLSSFKKEKYLLNKLHTLTNLSYIQSILAQNYFGLSRVLWDAYFSVSPLRLFIHKKMKKLK